MLKFFLELKNKHQVVFALIISIAVVAIWRGMWGLMDWYMFPSDPILSYILSIVIGLVILLATGAIVESLPTLK